MKKLAIIGAGGHGKVLADAARASGLFKDIVFIDASFPSKQTVLDIPVVGNDDSVPELMRDGFEFIVAVGDNQTRRGIYEWLDDCQAIITTVTHPSAILAQEVCIHSGSTVFANVVVNADTVIKTNVIINSGAIIEHDCTIGSHSHIAPRATLTGGVKVGTQTLVGAGVTVLPGKTIGDNCIIGAGAVVTKDIPNNSVATGIPASW